MFLSLDERLLAEVVLDQLHQSCHSFLFIHAIGDQGDHRTLGDAQGQHAQKALGVNTTLFLLDPNAALELIGLLDEIRGGAGMQTYVW